MQENLVIPTIADWQPVAEDIINTVTPTDQAAVVALVGEVGVGKTTFVQTIARVLGVVEPVTSPTFTILKRYATTSNTIATLIHMDAYRIDTTDELTALQFTSLLHTPQTLICIEWADNIKPALPIDTFWYTLSINAAGDHTIQKQ
jgi:tRNA threonylcarbamoyladenosine biosynthesis protein TsaE